MSHSHVFCLIHIVFSTAERRPSIRDDLRERLHAYLGGIARENGILTLAIGGAADHLHLLLSLPPTVSVAKAVQLLKSGSSNWVVKYILTQAEHHKRVGFADEFKKFLAAQWDRGMNQPSLAGLVSSVYLHPGLRPGLRSGRPFGAGIRSRDTAHDRSRSLRELLVELPILLFARVVCSHNVITRAPVLAFLLRTSREQAAHTASLFRVQGKAILQLH